MAEEVGEEEVAEEQGVVGPISCWMTPEAAFTALYHMDRHERGLQDCVREVRMTGSVCSKKLFREGLTATRLLP